MNDFKFYISEKQKKCEVLWNDEVIYLNGKINRVNVNKSRYTYGNDKFIIKINNQEKEYKFFKENNWDYHEFKININDIVEISANGTNDVNIDIVYNNGLEVDEVVEYVSFTKELIPIIQKVADYYKKDLLEEDFEIIGYVTKLHQEIEEEKGEITLSCLLEKKLKKVKMILNEEQYLIAQEAHKNKKLLACRGTLNMFDRSTILSNVTSVLIEENEL